MFSFRTTALEDQLDRALLDGNVACFCTQNCWDTVRKAYMYDLFIERANLKKLFYPKSSELSPNTNHIHFEREELLGLHAIVVEIQDVGSRYSNYTKDVFHLMYELSLLEEAPALYIVDHHNPAGRLVEGSMPNCEVDKYVPKVAHRHGLTLGELATLYYNEISAKFPLHIISALASEANRQLLPWTIAPSSDISGMFTCSMFSGGSLWNSTTISPAIGTSRAYEYIGAPFIKHNKLDSLPTPASALMRPCTFTPSAGIYSQQDCKGYQIMLLPGYEYHSLMHTLQLIRYFKERYSSFELLEGFEKKLGDTVLLQYINAELSYQQMQEHIKTQEQKWIRKAKRYCLYDNPPVRIK